MSLKGFQSRDIENPRGAWTRSRLLHFSPNRAFVAQNVRFSPHLAETRDGYGNKLDQTGQVTSMYNWVTSGVNRLLYMDNGVVKFYNITSAAAPETLFTPASTRAISVAEGATRAFIASFNTSGYGSAEVRVVTGIFGSAVIDKAFAAPMQVTSASGSEPGASGNVTAGQHRFGFIARSRSGFTGFPSPVNSGNVHQPVTFTASGGKKVRLSVTADIPSDIDFAYPIMTRTDNLEKWFFVPAGTFGGDGVALPGGAAGWSFSFDIDISDEDLADRATSADPQFFYLVQSQSGSGPISPGVVKTFGERMGYIADSDIYFSDKFNHQAITTALHKRQLPGQRSAVTAVVIRGVFYAIGPSWTYSFSDRDDTPSTWPQPQHVGSIGTTAPLGVCDRTAGDYAWVAAESGLYLFSGAYTEKPVSFLHHDWWKRINWAAAYAIQVVDDFINQIVYVGVPIDSATEMSHILTFDYKNGMEPDQIDFNIDTFSTSVFTSGQFSSIALVLNPTTKRNLIWVGPKDGNSQILEVVADQKRDVTFAIDSIWESGHVVPSGRDYMKRFAGLQADVRGNGTLSLTAYTKDHVRSKALPSVALETAPDKEYESETDLSHSENFSVEFRTNAVDAYFKLSRFRPYWKGTFGTR